MIVAVGAGWKSIETRPVHRVSPLITKSEYVAKLGYPIPILYDMDMLNEYTLKLLYPTGPVNTQRHVQWGKNRNQHAKAASVMTQLHWRGG